MVLVCGENCTTVLQCRRKQGLCRKMYPQRNLFACRMRCSSMGFAMSQVQNTLSVAIHTSQHELRSSMLAIENEISNERKWDEWTRTPTIGQVCLALLFLTKKWTILTSSRFLCWPIWIFGWKYKFRNREVILLLTVVAQWSQWSSRFHKKFMYSNTFLVHAHNNAMSVMRITAEFATLDRTNRFEWLVCIWRACLACVWVP